MHIYTTDLQKLKDFYVNVPELEFFSEDENRSVFIKFGKSMLLIFNPEKTLNTDFNKGYGGEINKRFDSELFPPHDTLTHPLNIHFALEIDKSDYNNAKKVLIENNIEIEKEIIWDEVTAKSLYFRDPSGNLVEIITNDHL